MNVKMNIYQGKDKNESGVTAFDTTKTIIDNYNKGDVDWDVSHIVDRQKYLIGLIENMLDISEDDIDKIIEEEQKANSLHKWQYNNEYLTNKGLVLSILKDYINANNIKDYYSIPKEIRDFKMYSHELIKNENNEEYTYTKLDCDYLSVYVRTICLKNDTNKFIDMMKKYFDFDLIKLESEKEVYN